MRIIKKITNQKTIIESFFSLSILNGLNVFLPLVTLPYILRVIGASNYGIYSFTYILIQYAVIITSYGFNFSATKQISQNRDNLTALTRIYNSVIVSKLILALFSFILLFTYYLFNQDAKKELIMLLLGTGIVIGDIFIPVWLFQGLEKMRYLTFINLISKSIFTALIFIIIKEADDFKYIIGLNSLGYLTAGLFSTILVHNTFNLKFRFPKKSEIIFQLKDGAALFGSFLGMELYRNANIFILRFFVSDAAVGIYAAAEKVIKGVQMGISPIAQALFPHYSLKFSQQSVNSNIKTLKKILINFGFIALLISILTYITAPYLTQLLCGNGFESSTKLIKIMSPVIFFGGINYVLGIIGMVNLNKQNSFFKFVTLAGVISISFVLITTNMLGNSSSAWAMTISEFILSILCIIFLKKLSAI